MRVPAINCVGAALASATSAMIMTRRGEEIILEVGKFFERIRDDKRRIVRIGLIPIMAALNHVRDAAASPITAAVRHEELPALIVIKAPLIAAALGKNFELMAHRMVAPHAGAQLGAF